MSDPSGIPGGLPPGVPGSPEAPITPPPAPPTMPDFGPTKAPNAKPMNGIGQAALIFWILGIVVFVIVAGFILVQVVKGFSADPFGGGGPFGDTGDTPACTWTHEPTPEEQQACVDSGDLSTP
ncbi:MAG: hypothetical protein J0H64_01795 [Actinobacteria bacterium]|nr:hypothetical protein [Actinomycetota bacterium]